MQGTTLMMHSLGYSLTIWEFSLCFITNSILHAVIYDLQFLSFFLSIKEVTESMTSDKIK